MEIPAPTYPGVVPICLGILDEPQSLYCLGCGQPAILSLAFAARQGWKDFEDDAAGCSIGAICPVCATPAND